MSLIQETDFGTPLSRSERHGAGGHLDHARGDGSRNADPETVRD
jgi:hypothetical protein